MITKWETKLLISTRKRIEELMNEMGEEGWEPVGLSESSMSWTVIMKRPKQ